MTESLTLAGNAISSLIEHAVTHDGTRAALRHFGEFWSAILHDSDFNAGCPVVSVVVGGSPEDQHLQSTAADIFERWHDALVRAITSEGVDPTRAPQLATMAIAAIEGAVMLCRTQRSTSPLDDVLAELDILLTSVTPDTRGDSPR
ncbi:MAG: TetR/AcrR family transcriptional regulator [Mycobacterium sp.]